VRKHIFCFIVDSIEVITHSFFHVDDFLVIMYSAFYCRMHFFVQRILKKLHILTSMRWWFASLHGQHRAAINDFALSIATCHLRACEWHAQLYLAYFAFAQNHRRQQIVSCTSNRENFVSSEHFFFFCHSSRHLPICKKHIPWSHQEKYLEKLYINHSLTRQCLFTGILILLCYTILLHTLFGRRLHLFINNLVVIFIFLVIIIIFSINIWANADLLVSRWQN